MGGGAQRGQRQATVVDGMQSNPPPGGSRVVNIFVDSEGKLEIEYEV